MATPNFVRFSRAPGTAEDVLTRFDFRVLQAHGLEFDRFAALRPDQDPLTAAYTGGLDLDGEMVPCTSRAEALSLARDRSAWGLSFLMRPARAHVNLYLFAPDRDSVGVAMSFDSSILGYQTQELAPGEWLRGLLITTVSALACQVCGYGADDAYRVSYQPLEPGAVIARVRSGELFQKRYPIFHAISVDLLAAEEMDGLLERCPKNMFFQYALSTTGYHILSVLTRQAGTRPNQT
jgi:hypothetical protein